MSTAITDWSTTPGDNDAPPPNGAPEGMPASSVNDCIRTNMAAVRGFFEEYEWRDLGLSGLLYVDGNTFRIPGDVTAIYTVGRRVRATGTTPFDIFGIVTASTYNAPNTDIDVSWDSGASIDNTLETVSIGFHTTGKPISAIGVDFPDGSVPNEALASDPIPAGFFQPCLRSTAPSGWVIMAGTVGNASSNATRRANADTFNLYEVLWALDPEVAPILTSAGAASTRGADAATDFAANKQITIPDPSGHGIVALDNISGTAQNISQKSTTISTTNGSPTATVASATGLFVGMYVNSANVPAGTTITAISGTTLTLSGNASSTASGTTARFSPLRDAQVMGRKGGELGHTNTIPETAEHFHQAMGDDIDTTNGGYPDATQAIAKARTGGASASPNYTLGISTALPIAGRTSSTGGGLPHNNLQPSFVANFMIKL